MNGIAIAVSLHLLAVVIWIGGVGLVTTVSMPSIRRHYAPEARLRAFLAIEGRFVWQARCAVLVAGGSGLWMLQSLQLWSAFMLPHYWWLHEMVALWSIFVVMLFLIEPLFLHAHLAATKQPAVAFDRLEILHRFPLLLSLIVVAGAAAGSHGF